MRREQGDNRPFRPKGKREQGGIKESMSSKREAERQVRPVKGTTMGKITAYAFLAFMALRALPALVPKHRKSSIAISDGVVWSPTRTRLTLNLASVEGVNKGNVLSRLVLVVQAKRNL